MMLEIQKGVTAMYELNDKKIGTHLKELIDERGYKSTADFCRRYLIEKYNTINYTEDKLDEDLKTAKNTFSKILNGKQRITLEQLPILSKLLCVSCEEILSAGKKYAPTINHITNYEIAQSSDRNIWDEYMKREDKLFLNCDEYRKTVIDYALEFKNYGFIKYLLDEEFIWFVDNSTEGYGLYYGAGTSIKQNLGRFDSDTDNFIPREFHEQDRLRTQTAVLAIENGDCDALELLRAREIPEIDSTFSTITDYPDFKNSRNENLIEAIARSNDKRIIDYFTEEYVLPDKLKVEDRLFVFPFLGEVILKLIENKSEFAESVIRRVIEHNKNVYEKLSALIDDEYNYLQSIGTYGTEKELKRQIARYFKHDDSSDCVSLSIISVSSKAFVGNIIKVESQKMSSEKTMLIEELNRSYEKVISLGGE